MRASSRASRSGATRSGATPRRSPAARRWSRAALLATLAAGTLPLFPVPAGATPAADAAHLAAQTAQQLTQVDEQVHQAQLQGAGEQKAADDAHVRAAAAQAAVDAYAPQLRAIAQAGLTDGGHSRIAAFLTSGSATALVQQMTTLDMIASHTASVITQVGIAEQAAQKAKAEADADAAKAQASLTALQQQEKTLQSQVAAYQASYAHLPAG